MNRKFIFIMIAILTLASVTLACSLFGGGDESTAVAPVDDSAPAEDVSPAEAEEAEAQPAPADKPAEPQPASDPNLGDEYRSVGGGYAFQPISDYTLEEIFGITIMNAPDADPNLGPLIMLIGGTNEEEMSIEQMLAGPTGEIDASTEILDQREVTVNGYPATQVDFKGIQFEQEVMGRVVIVAVSPTQQFVMFGSAPSDRWEAVGPLFDAMLASVYFFEPEDIDFSDMLEDEALDAGEGELVRQWASFAYASSEYNSPDYGAMQATGAPNTTECGDQPTAWASLSSSTLEWIELDYDIPVYPTEINIIQSYSPDQVVRVEVIDEFMEYHSVYTGAPEDKLDECPYTLSIPVDFDDPVVGVKITLDQSVISSPWNEIDAVELVGFTAGGASLYPGDETFDYGNLSPGEFEYTIIGDDGTFTIIENGSIQDQSTTSEYVIGLVSQDERHTMTLFMPHELSDIMLTVTPYNASSLTHGPGAAIYVGFTLYTANDGFFVFEEITADFVTGTFFFNAANQDDPNDIIQVTGSFNELPLGNQ